MQNPELIQKAVSGTKQLDEKNMRMLMGFINRMLKKKQGAGRFGVLFLLEL